MYIFKELSHIWHNISKFWYKVRFSLHILFVKRYKNRKPVRIIRTTVIACTNALLLRICIECSRSHFD